MLDHPKHINDPAVRSSTDISPFALALSLPEIERAHRRADHEWVVFQGEVVEKNTLKRTADKVEFQKQALIALLLESKANTLHDAAAQLLHAYSSVVDLEDHYARQAARAILSSFFVVASAADIDIDQIGFEFYAPSNERPAEHFPSLESAFD